MATNFSSLGFDIRSQKQMEALLLELAPQAEPVPTYVGGAYLRYATPEGCELWAQLSPTQQLVGCNPHFAGRSRFRVKVTAVQAHGATPLDGQLIAELAEDEPGVPIIINVPDYQQYAARLSTPTPAVVQITGIAQELHLFATTEELSRSAFGGIASDGAMIPTGTLMIDGEKTVRREPPLPLALLAGRIQSISRLHNSLSRLPFYVFQVKTLGGLIDIVADPEYVVNEPSVGGIVVGAFFLSGRLIEPLPPPPQATVDSTLRIRDKSERTPWWTRIFSRGDAV
jgi:hypothetical protein